MTLPPGFHAARHDTRLYVRVIGLANMKVAPILDTFLAREVADGATTVCIDLGGCTGMDSTFMGLLVLYAGNTMEAGGKLVILNPTEGGHKLLCMLGVDAVVAVVRGCQLPEVPFVHLDATPGLPDLQRIALVKRAHESLVSLNQANQVKFAAFLQALEHDLGRAAP